MAPISLTPPHHESPSAQADPAQILFSYKRMALAQAQATARAQAPADAAEPARATLEDYRLAFNDLLPRMEADGITFKTPKDAAQAAADLSGQTLDNILIKEEKGHPVPAFYDNLKFHDSIVTHSLVDPAASFNAELKDAREISHTIFNDHDDGKNHGKFELGHGKYTDVNLTNFNGGEVIMNGSHVSGLHMEGQKITTLNLRHGTRIDDLHAENAHLVRIEADPGTSIVHSNFKSATISMAGHMNGIEMSRVDFTGANLYHVDLKEARLTHVVLPKNGCHGLNLSGAKLADVTLDDGTPLTSVAQMKGLGITFDAKQPPIIMQSEGQAKAAAVHPVKQALAGLDLASLGITGGAAANLADVTPGNAVKELASPTQTATKEAAPDRGYYARMSENNGKPS